MVQSFHGKTMKKVLFLFISFTFLLVACSGKEDAKNSPATTVESPVTELQIIDVASGDGKKAKRNFRVAVHYTGWLYDESAPDKKGKKFDSSHDRKQPFVFSLGNKSVIEGWEQGVEGMQVGGKRTLIIPPHMGYGAKGFPPVIPPNAALVFDIELLQAG